MTPEEDVYPGWGDLLLELSNYDAPEEGRVGTPLFRSMLDAHSFIRRRYLSVTERSWDRRIDGETDAPDIYGLAAKVLNGSRSTVLPRRAHFGEPPVVTAFVTSFDLELELSLLKAGNPFAVVLPVHVYDSRTAAAQTCWIALAVDGCTDEVNRGARLKALIDPHSENWRVVDDIDDSKAGPIVVVRLAGCPLIKLPCLAALPKRLGDALRRLHPASGSDPELGHAVITHEHDAEVQGVIDLVSFPIQEKTPGEIPTKVSDGVGRYGLPMVYASGERRWSRFWMMLGVQMQDRALRQRIATVVSSLPLMANPPILRVSDIARRNGVAINRFATELEQDLLIWNGFDVVLDDVTEFAGDLEHYAVHMEDREPGSRLRGCPCVPKRAD